MLWGGGVPGDVGRDGDDWDGPRDLPKLNLQFLSFGEYLERTSELYSLEAAHDIRTISGSATVPRVLKKARARVGRDGRAMLGGHDAGSPVT